MKNTIKISLLTIFAIVLLTSCNGEKDKETAKIDDTIKQNIQVVETTKKVEVKEEETMMKEKVVENTTSGNDMIDSDKKENADTMVENKTMDTVKGEYIDYSEEKLANAKGKKVLFFHATWCPSCVAGDKMLKSSTILDGLTILKADYDTYSDLKKKYSVLSQHTFVQIDDDGNMLAKWVGARDITDIENNLVYGDDSNTKTEKSGEVIVKEFQIDSFTEIKDGEYFPQFSIKNIEVNKGDTVRLKINTIKGLHDFKLDEFNVFSETPEGKVTTIEFVVDKSGTFEYYCSKPNHRKNGHFGTIVVK